jgi:thiol-disulfide isomerase/thioredoxin
MSNILVLGGQNFAVIGRERKVLGTNVNGTVLVLFKITGDPNCSSFEPIFAKLATKEKRVTFAVLDIQQHRNIVNASHQTITPITGVPLLILYINGTPKAKYNGARTEQGINTFLNKALTDLSSTPAPPPQQQFMTHTPSSASQQFHTQPEKHTNMYGGSGQQNKIYEPKFDNVPSMKNVIRGGGGYSRVNQNPGGADDDGEKMLMPDGIIPHNKPWVADYESFS